MKAVRTNARRSASLAVSGPCRDMSRTSGRDQQLAAWPTGVAPNYPRAEVPTWFHLKLINKHDEEAIKTPSNKSNTNQCNPRYVSFGKYISFHDSTEYVRVIGPYYYAPAATSKFHGALGLIDAKWSKAPRNGSASGIFPTCIHVRVSCVRSRRATRWLRQAALFSWWSP